jgi:peptidoglycan-associated lipoprotein
MKARQLFFLAALVGAVFSLQSCRRSSNDVWEDTKSAGRHMQRGFRSLGGKHGDSRQIRCRNDFECIEDENCCPEGNFQDCDYQDSCSAPQDNYYTPQDYYSPADSYSVSQDSYYSDFVPLQDPDNELAVADVMARPPRETPGEQGSSIPGIQAFRDPSTNPQLASLFRPIYFDYNSDLVKGPQNLQIIHNIADFLRSHPNMYIFIEGHTDERGPQAYNLALGARRANSVRNLLVNEGISPDRLFTISYGKERPVILERHEEGWAKNRRDEFKIYER